MNDCDIPTRAKDTSDRKLLLIEQVTDGDPIPLEDWVSICVDRIDARTIAIGGDYWPDDEFRSHLLISSWTDFEEAKEIGKILAERASCARLLLSRSPCTLVVNDDS